MSGGSGTSLRHVSVRTFRGCRVGGRGAPVIPGVSRSVVPVSHPVGPETCLPGFGVEGVLGAVRWRGQRPGVKGVGSFTFLTRTCWVVDPDFTVLLWYTASLPLFVLLSGSTVLSSRVSRGLSRFPPHRRSVTESRRPGHPNRSSGHEGLPLTPYLHQSVLPSATDLHLGPWGRTWGRDTDTSR